MAQWQVIRDYIELLPHPNADTLQLGKVGPFQVVVKSGLYNEGDEVVFAPEKSILPFTLAEPFRSYLRGKDKNRVGSTRIRGELSMGVLFPVDMAEVESNCELPRGICLASRMGIEKYEPPIPQDLAGEVEAAPQGILSQHDVEQFGIYASCFKADEIVWITEKLHGSQAMYFLTSEGQFGLSSKGLLSRGLIIKDSPTNAYWNAARNCGIESMMREYASDNEVTGTLQFFGEVIPVQGGNWSYGLSKSRPEVRLFDVRVDGESVPVESVYDRCVKAIWVPIIKAVRFGDANLDSLCKGMEQVSGKELHIREGIVVRPQVDRRAPDGTRLMVKVINPKYAKGETGDEVS